MRLLCVGDIHLGRQPSRLPSTALTNLTPDRVSPAAAWRKTVAAALRLGVDAVVLSGDVVDQNDDFFEAYADLRRGTQQLADSGIRVFGVSGNHDVLVLPRLARTLPGFHLLGADGQWELHPLEDASGVRLNLLGWSFPQQTVTRSPLAQALPPTGDGPTIGVLHCDRDQRNSRYAPVTSAELADTPVNGWLLGHIHKPDPLRGPRPSGYLGSLSALDPGEPGAHGPWLLSSSPNAGIAIEQLPLAPLRWETLTVSVADMDNPEDIRARITAALDDLHSTLAGQQYRPEAVGCRLRLAGRTPHRQALEALLRHDDPTAAPTERDGIVYFVEDWRNDALPALDLHALAAGSDPVALLARKILMLQGPDSPARREFLDTLRQRLQTVAERSDFRELDGEPPDDEETAELALRAALRALDALLAQQAGGA